MVRMTQQPLTFGVWLAGIIARWRLVLWVMAGTLVVAALAAVLLPPVYQAHASFVTAGSTNSKMASALAGNGAGLQGLASQLGVPSGNDPSESPNFYVRLIESEELKRRLLRSKFQDPRGNSPRDSATLLEIFRPRSDIQQRRMELGIKKLGQSISTDFDLKTNLVQLTVDARWSQLAAAIANRTIELVDAFNHEQRVSLARSKRLFVQSRLDSAKLQLQSAEERQRYFYDQNRQWKTSPQLVLEEQQLRRGVDVATDLFTTLQRQFETARLDEFNDAAQITVVDPAVPPWKAQWPRYWILLASSLFVGALLGIMVAGSATILTDWRGRNPATASALSDSIAALPFPLGERRRRPRVS
ncbi:MAG TPA: GNVR domain-containing protein [Gemmatimonadaceae bacterium]|nr:GNVR domain-containing protein [Gemmatimonadaceae bacterium]